MISIKTTMQTDLLTSRTFQLLVPMLKNNTHGLKLILQFRVVPSGGMNFVVDDANVNALSVKSYATFMDWVSVKFNGVSCTRNSYYNHLIMNERIKQYGADKYRLYGDLMNHEWDTGTGISYSATIGERNNNTLPTNLLTGSNPANIVNQGHLDRCTKIFQHYGPAFRNKLFSE